MGAGRRCAVGVALTVLALGAVGCGDDAGNDIELSTDCGDLRDHDEAEIRDALVALGPEQGWDGATADGVAGEVVALCERTSKARFEDILAAGARDSLTAASALVETYCRQTEIYIGQVEEQARHLDDLDSSLLENEGTELTNAALRLQAGTPEDDARVQECTAAVTEAALLLTPED